MLEKSYLHKFIYSYIKLEGHVKKVLTILQAEWSEFDDNISALVDKLESGEIQNEQLDAAKTELEAYKTKVKEVKYKFVLKKKNRLFILYYNYSSSYNC